MQRKTLLNSFTLKSRLCLALVLILFFSPSIFADDLTQIYKQQTLNVLEQLAEQGLTHFGCTVEPSECLKVSDIQTSLEVDEFVFISIQDFEKPEGANRWTAFSPYDSNVIFLNSNQFHSTELAGYIGVHELLGKHGLDTEYESSLRMWAILNETKNSPLIPVLIKDLQNPRKPRHQSVLTPDNYLAISSGGTVVGGGGEYRSFELRINVLQSIFKDLDSRLASPAGKSTLLFLTRGIEITNDENIENIKYVYSESSPHLPKKILVPSKLCEESMWDLCVLNISEVIIQYFSWVSPFGKNRRKLHSTLIYSKELKANFFFPSKLSVITSSFAREYFYNLYNYNCPLPDSCIKEIDN